MAALPRDGTFVDGRYRSRRDELDEVERTHDIPPFHGARRRLPGGDLRRVDSRADDSRDPPSRLRLTMNHWVFDPIALACLLATAVLYAAGISRLWARAGIGSGVRPWQICAFAGGWIALVVALLSPIAAISDFLFSVHMTQHEILILVAAPLLVLGRPIVPFLWAFTPRWRLRMAAWSRNRYWAGSWQALTNAIVVWVLHGLALWIWHLPALYQAALGNAAIHAAEHLCFLVTACLV